MLKKILTLFSLISLGFMIPLAFAHEGEVHPKDKKEQKTSMKLLKGKSSDFKITLGYTPSGPMTGQELQFEFKVVQLLAEADPLLGNEIPLGGDAKVTAQFKSSVTGKFSSEQISAHSEGEGGVYGVHYTFEGPGTYLLSLNIVTAGGEVINADFPFTVKKAPTNWVKLMGNIFIISLALYAFAFQANRALRAKKGTGRSLARSTSSLLITMAVTVALLFGVNYFVFPKFSLSRIKSQAGGGAIDLTEGAALEGEMQSLLDIKTSVAEERTIEQRFTALGKVEARAQSIHEVHSPVPGLVFSARGIPTIGDFVRARQTLAVVEQILTAPEKIQLSTESLRIEAAIIQAKNRMNQALIDYQRAQRLLEVKAIALKDVQQAKLTYDNAVAEYESALKQKEIYDSIKGGKSRNPSRYPIHAPISGIVTAVDLAPGELVDTNKKLFTIADLSRMWVEAQVYEKDLAQILKAKKAYFTTEAFPGEIFEGKLLTLGSIVNDTTRTTQVIFEVPNPAWKLRIGMFANIAIDTGEPIKAITVPPSAVIDEAGRKVIYVDLGGGNFARREVEVGLADKDFVSIKKGINPGEKVVMQGAYLIRSTTATAARSAPGSKKEEF